MSTFLIFHECMFLSDSCFYVSYFAYRNKCLKDICMNATTDYSVYRFLRTICFGFLEYRKKEKKQLLFGFWRTVALYRTGFLRMLWCLWCICIPNFCRNNLRKIDGIKSELNDMQLYYHMIDHFSDCVNKVVFCSFSEVNLKGVSKPLMVPSRWSKFEYYLP